MRRFRRLRRVRALLIKTPSVLLRVWVVWLFQSSEFVLEECFLPFLA